MANSCTSSRPPAYSSEDICAQSTGYLFQTHQKPEVPKKPEPKDFYYSSLRARCRNEHLSIEDKATQQNGILTSGLQCRSGMPEQVRHKA